MVLWLMVSYLFSRIYLKRLSTPALSDGSFRNWISLLTVAFVTYEASRRYSPASIFGDFLPLFFLKEYLEPLAGVSLESA